MHLAAIPAPSYDQRLVVFGAVLAQVEDIHGVAWSLTDAQRDEAERMFQAMEEHPSRTALDQGVLASLAVLVHDVDHPDLPQDQWDALDALLAELGREFNSSE